MRPGFYIVTRNTTLSHPNERFKVLVEAGTWIVTDGIYVGWFEREEQLDWVPLQWKRSLPVVLEEGVENQLDKVVRSTSVHRLEDEFFKLVFVEPGEPVPDMPKPSFRNLANYLKSRRYLTASESYDRR